MSERKRFEIIGCTIWVCDGEYEEELWNPQIVQILNKQQATIEQLQDLCGQSDGENAKLRIENEQLRKDKEQLKERLREYGRRLDRFNCR